MLGSKIPTIPKKEIKLINKNFKLMSKIIPNSIARAKTPNVA